MVFHQSYKEGKDAVALRSRSDHCFGSQIYQGNPKRGQTVKTGWRNKILETPANPLPVAQPISHWPIRVSDFFLD